MNNTGTIKIRDINVLRESKYSVEDKVGIEQISRKQTPEIAERKKKAEATVKFEAGGKRAKREEQSGTANNGETRPKTISKKEPPPTQKRIDTFFKSCSKTYTIEADISNHKDKMQATLSSKAKTSKRRAGKRLHRNDDDEDNSTEFVFTTTKTTRTTRRMTKKVKTIKKSEIFRVVANIDLCTDSETEEVIVFLPVNDEVKTKEMKRLEAKPLLRLSMNSTNFTTTETMPNSACKTAANVAAAAIPTLSASSTSSSVSCIGENTAPIVDTAAALTATKCQKSRPCPPYKIIAGTTFAVDAFQFGQIEGVSHYFLTHFHADHYVGLTRKFSMPIYMSSCTACLVRAFIPLEDKYLHEMNLNDPQVIENVEVTAIDANHCPGAVMFVFKFTTGKCILHTGDFRACGEMESEPIFWNNDIHTIYLDTTYISSKYNFCTQHESIDRAKALVTDFRNKHADKRILYICGSYVIGKEKFWSALAKEFELKVWTEDKRKKALQAMQLKDVQGLLCDNPLEANMHVITLGKLSYVALTDYFLPFSNHFDILLALRPSGWEKNSKPQYGRKINIMGIEYSEHSGHNELQRFVKYLKPCEVISTVPVGSEHDLMITSNVPLKWYKYDKLSSMQRNYQPSITTYLKLKKKNKPNTTTSPSGSSKFGNLSSMKSSKSKGMST